MPNFGADNDIANIKEAIGQTENKLDYKWNPVQDLATKEWIVPQPIDSSSYSYRPWVTKFELKSKQTLDRKTLNMSFDYSVYI